MNTYNLGHIHVPNLDISHYYNSLACKKPFLKGLVFTKNLLGIIIRRFIMCRPLCQKTQQHITP